MKSVVVLLASCLLLPACASTRVTTDSLSARTIADVKDHREVVLPSGLKYIDLKAGTGAGPVGPDTIASVAYTGYLKDGTQFDSTFKRREPFQFRLGHKQTIAGWEQGIPGMYVGGVRRLIIPPELGYGHKGIPGLIPPDATLLFDITLLEIKK